MRKGKCLLIVQAMEKTLELLELLSMESEQLPIGALADQLHVSRTCALLLLVTLESRGMVYWDDAARVYRAAAKTAEMARQFLNLSVPEQRVPAASRKMKSRPTGAMKLRSTAGLR